MIPLNLMPFMANYWPYVMGGLFLYTVLYLLIDKTREQMDASREKEKEKEVKKRERERKEKKDTEGKEGREESSSDGELEFDEPKPAVNPADLKHIQYEHSKYTEDEMLKRSEDFYQLMNKRRTLRYFSSKPVPETIIENIIRTAGTSPSGAHTEPWTYVLVSDPRMKEDIRHVIESEEETNYRQRMARQWVADLKFLHTDWTKPYLTEAPYIVLLFKQTYGLGENGARINHYYNEISCGISVGLFLSAVENCGLVTLTSTPLNCSPALRGLCGRPKNEKLLFVLPLGYPADDATVPKLSRKSLQEILVKFQ